MLDSKSGAIWNVKLKGITLYQPDEVGYKFRVILLRNTNEVKVLCFNDVAPLSTPLKWVAKSSTILCNGNDSLT